MVNVLTEFYSYLIATFPCWVTHQSNILKQDSRCFYSTVTFITHVAAVGIGWMLSASARRHAFIVLSWVRGLASRHGLCALPNVAFISQLSPILPFAYRVRRHPYLDIGKRSGRTPFRWPVEPAQPILSDDWNIIINVAPTSSVVCSLMLYDRCTLSTVRIYLIFPLLL